MTMTVSINVEFGSDPDIVTIRKSSRSTPIIGDVLGIETAADGSPYRVFLRNKIHRNEATEYRGWAMSGAISTILTRQQELQT
ncbi:hypothetical protein [Pseudovibrio sp. Ad37]|uniref:hypothetical protein n=1 Tax=Pseudovibrio sp. Ad37 TaxID=989422 RepID=UPI0007AEBFCB|nr:hypothetical protein [Pseudovibrio sp. Ad37]KZL22676.1 hypothetical protein PsAD37_03324 [Pseudovibrio sp. Ad37]